MVGGCRLFSPLITRLEPRLTPHAKGLLYAALAIICISPDTLLIRLADVDFGATLFWRGLFSAIGLAVLVVAMNGKKTAKSFHSLGKPGLAVIVLFSVSNITFVMALQLITVANTLVIVTCAPVFAAILGRLFLAEAASLRTWLTTGVVIASITYIFANDLQSTTLLGNLCAVATALSVAAAFVVTRHAKHIDMTPATASSSLLSTVIAIPFVGTYNISGEALLLLALLGGFLTVSYTLLFLAPRYISAAEVSLLLPLETILGSFLVWIFIGEEPSLRTIVGGVIIITALTANSLIGIRQMRPA